MEKESIEYVEIIFAELLFSVVYIFARWGGFLGNENLAFARVFFAAVFLGVIGLLFKKYSIQKIKKEKIKILFFGILHGFIILASFVSLNLLTISSAVILQSTIGIWTAILSILILKEKLELNVVYALVLSFVGLIFIIEPSLLIIKESFIGILAALFVGVFGGLVYVMSKTFSHYNKMSLAFWQNLIAAPFLLPLLFFNFPIINGFSVFIFLSLGLFGGLAFLFLYLGIEKIKGQRASVLTLLYVVFTIVLGVVFFGEVPALRELIGGLFVVGGAYLSTR